MSIKVIQIKASDLKVKAMWSELEQAVKEERDAADIEFSKTYSTWSHKPKFEKDFSSNSSQIIGSTLTSGDGSKDNPYPFVTKGTSVRYATMTDDFSPKSTKRVISSKGGRGGVLYVDKRKPRPGIEAREFEEEIAKREQPKFTKRMTAAMKKAASVSGHKI